MNQRAARTCQNTNWQPDLPWKSVAQDQKMDLQNRIPPLGFSHPSTTVSLSAKKEKENRERQLFCAEYLDSKFITAIKSFVSLE